jgi:dTDP-4-amino-4,6-dideoxygalactose transaminase
MKIHHSKPFLEASDKSSVCNVIDKAFLSYGETSKLFSTKIASTLNKKYAIATQSGTDALTASIYALNLKKGDKIIVPAYVCSALLDAIAANDCIPIPVDISKKSLGINIDLVNEQQKNVAAVIGAHMFGIPSPLYKIKHINLIEDCAQTLNVSIDNHKVGSMGQISVCSFYATKLLTTGHGGAVASDNIEIYEKLLKNFNHDKNNNWEQHRHFLMSDFNASLGIVQIDKLDRMIIIRNEIASRFRKALGENDKIISNNAYSRFIVESLIGIDELLNKFNISGIEAKRPIYLPIYKYLNIDCKNFPNTQWAYNHIISIPLYPSMTELEIEYIETFLREHKNEMRCRPSA